MATSLAYPLPSAQSSETGLRQERGFALLLVTALTFAALLLHGYHPYVEDGGVYVPEIKRLVNPALYPHGTEFVVEHLRYSVFAPAMAQLVLRLRLRVETVLFLAYLVSLWTTLFAAYLLAVRCYHTRQARVGAVTLLAAWITLPIAGTSLMLMDPYLTARSLSTPCALLALVGAFDFMQPRCEVGTRNPRRAWGLLLCAAALASAVALHPLMGAYAVASVLLLGVCMASNRTARVWGAAGLVLAALGCAVGLVLGAPAESAVYKQVVMTRYYWFLSQWQWYEWAGVIAPLLILAWIAFRPQQRGAAQQSLARMAFAAGSIALLVALLFARPAMQTHLLARLQPLRMFQEVYIVMILALGAHLAEHILRRHPWRWLTAFACLAGVLSAAERTTFRASNHIELPWKISQPVSQVVSWPGRAMQDNAWEQAFVWIRRHTPVDALFALDAHYITAPGEDAQSFRAIAERSALPDYSKDGGVVANKPRLSAPWLNGQQAQSGLNVESDAARSAALKPFGVTWVVLDSGAITQYHCEFSNAAVKVCRLP